MHLCAAIALSGSGDGAGGGGRWGAILMKTTADQVTAGDCFEWRGQTCRMTSQRDREYCYARDVSGKLVAFEFAMEVEY